MEQLQWIKRPAGISDFEQISTYGYSGRRSSTREYFIWKLINNPIQEGFANVADHNGQIVGTTTVTPKNLGIKGQLVVGAEIGDTFTAPTFQRRGIFTSLVNLSREAAIDKNLQFIYGTPNNNSLPGYERNCNFKKIDSVTIQMLIWPVNFANLLRTKLTSEPLVRVLSPIASSLFMLRYLVNTDKEWRNDFTIAKLPDEFPQSVDSLAQKSLAAHGWVLFRDKTYLDWRFVQNPDRYDIWVAVKEEIFFGYIVCKIGDWQNLRVGYLADFLVDEEQNHVYQALLSHAMRFFFENKVDMIAVWAVKGTHYSDTLKRRGFLKAWSLPLICYNNIIGSTVASSVNRWHFTMADSDNI